MILGSPFRTIRATRSVTLRVSTFQKKYGRRFKSVSFVLKPQREGLVFKGKNRFIRFSEGYLKPSA